MKKAKLPDESFSDTIQRLLKKESNIEKVIELYGTASVDDPEEEKILLEIYEDSRKELRKSFNSQFQ